MRLTLALILTAFLLGGCGGDTEPLQARIDSLETANNQLRTELSELKQETRAEESQRVLDPPVYFRSGSAWLTTEARRTLDSLATVLTEQYPDRAFHIRGYTDSRPIAPSWQDVYPSNWYLSAHRAAAVAHYLDEQHDLQTPRLDIGAFGPQDPVAPNETPSGRQQNRRVEVVVNTPGSGE